MSSEEEFFFHGNHVCSDFLRLYQALLLVGKERSAQIEWVATAAKYPLSMGQLACAAFFCPFSIQRMYLVILGVSSYHISLARWISTVSVLLRLAQFSDSWLRS